MYAMLIVEDERWEREGLVEIWDWRELGIEIAGIAVDGVDGYEKAMQLQPDIIVTDIRMPGLSGLEMAKKIREQLPDVRIVVLTGYSDFEYTREAITMDVDDYVLKPIEEEELSKTMLRIKEKCRQIRAERDRELRLVQRLQTGDLLAAEKLLTDLLLGRQGNQEAVAAELKELDPSLDVPFYAVAIAVPSEAAVKEDIIRNQVASGRYAVPCDDYSGGLTFVLPLKEKAEATLQAESLFEGWGSISPQPFVIGLSQPVHTLARLGEAYRDGVQAAEHGVFSERSGIITLEEAAVARQIWEDSSATFRSLWLEQCRQLRLHILTLQEKAAADELQKMFVLLRQYAGAGRAYISALLYALLIELSLLEDERVRERGGATSTGRLDGNALLAIGRMQELHDSVLGYITSLMGRLDTKRNRKDEYIAEKTIRLIEEKYGSNDISLTMLASEMFVSQNHLGVLFKKATGMTVHQYIMEVRMRKAEELLRKTKQKVSEVAEHIGMSNHSYFCTLFKQKHGMSPGEYQELMQRR